MNRRISSKYSAGLSPASIIADKAARTTGFVVRVFSVAWQGDQIRARRSDGNLTRSAIRPSLG